MVCLCKLLRTMSGELRKDLIEKELSRGQQLALQEFMMSHGQSMRKPSRIAGRRVTASDAPAQSVKSDPEPEPSGVKTLTQGGGLKFYAEAEVQRLRMSTILRDSQADAEVDHRALLRIVADLRDGCPAQEFTAKARAAVKTVAGDCGGGDILRSFCVSIPSDHWLGCRLKIYRNTLDGALDAWERLHAQSADCVQLFRGGQVSQAYTIERSTSHWKHLRQTYIELCLEDGRIKRDRAAVEAYLAKLEERRRPHVLRTEAIWLERKDKFDATMRDRFRNLVYAWERAKAATKREALLRDDRAQRRKAAPCRKRRSSSSSEKLSRRRTG